MVTHPLTNLAQRRATSVLKQTSYHKAKSLKMDKIRLCPSNALPIALNLTATLAFCNIDANPS